MTELYDDFITPYLRYNICTSQGKREYMEDACVALSLGPEIHLFAVFDGHGGDHTSKTLVRMFPVFLKWCLEENNGELTAFVLEDMFHKIDYQLYSIRKPNDSGSTVSGVIILKNKIFTFNLGDSRVYLLDQFSIPIFQSKDHKPISELRRIENARGFVRNFRVNGILAVSRSFGDFSLEIDQKPKGENSIISSQPDINIFNRESVKSIVIGTDGVWDGIDIQFIPIEFIKECKCSSIIKIINSNITDNKTLIIIQL